MNRTRVLLVLVTVAACAVEPLPEQTVVLLPAAPAGADLQRAHAVFDEWLSIHQRAPGAVFRLLQVGHERSTTRERFVVTIPARWNGSNAIASRDAFIAQARALFGTSIQIDAASSRLGPVNATPPGTTRITAVPDLDSRGARWRWTQGAGASHTAVLCDLSESARAACTPAVVLRAFDAWLSDAVVAGSSFRVWAVGRTIADAKQIFNVETPQLPAGERAAYLLGARNEVATAFERPAGPAGSDVAGAISAAVADLSRRHGARRLLVLSDLRQTTASLWAFDRVVPRGSEFVRWLEAEKLLPDCREIAITVCGLHFGTTPGTAAFDAKRDAEVRAVWIEAFTAMHAASIDLCGACEAEKFMHERGGV